MLRCSACHESEEDMAWGTEGSVCKLFKPFPSLIPPILLQVGCKSESIYLQCLMPSNSKCSKNNYKLSEKKKSTLSTWDVLFYNLKLKTRAFCALISKWSAEIPASSSFSEPFKKRLVFCSSPKMCQITLANNALFHGRFGIIFSRILQG